MTLDKRKGKLSMRRNSDHKPRGR